ncbi:MAG: hypothetical protein MHPSP_001425, partial [Paramarteilia canceri]
SLHLMVEYTDSESFEDQCEDNLHEDLDEQVPVTQNNEDDDSSFNSDPILRIQAL